MSTILPGQKDSLLPNPDQIPANERSMPSTGRCLVSTAASLAHGDEPLWAQLAKLVFEPGSAAMAQGLMANSGPRRIRVSRTAA
jgi:hypothetical protein